MGALAGRARITIRLTVTDLIAGNQIETFEAEGEPENPPPPGRRPRRCNGRRISCGANGYNSAV